jgi:hypothetical protein
LPEKSISKQIDAISAARLSARARALADPALREALLRLAGRAELADQTKNNR